MDFSLNENQLNYLETVRKLVKNDITPHILEMEKSHKFPWEIINKAWEMGIVNLCIPEDVKGYEIDVVSSSLIIKELSYGDTGISTSAMCNDLANVVISQHGTDSSTAQPRKRAHQWPGRVRGAGRVVREAARGARFAGRAGSADDRHGALDARVTSGPERAPAGAPRARTDTGRRGWSPSARDRRARSGSAAGSTRGCRTGPAPG